MFDYKPTKSGLILHNSAKYLKMLCGPYGSGKSCACAMDVLINAAAQVPASDGIRYSRVGVVRSSYPELQSATRRSLLEVLPSECGTIQSTGSPMRGFYMIPLPDGTKIQLELELWAIQTEDDTEKLKSANWTFAWVNEATGCVAAVYTAILSRIGRFPPASQGGPTWSGVIMDFNRPPIGSWLDEFLVHPKDNWEVIWQPPAAFKRENEDGTIEYVINRDAENLENLGSFSADDPPGFTAIDKGMRFYRDQIEALLKTGREDIVQNQYCLMAVTIQDGRSVYTNFSRERHVAKCPIEPVPLHDIIIGCDSSGLHPACVILQEQNGRWCLLDELFARDEPFEVFLNSMLVPLLRAKYASNPVMVALDPSNPRDSYQGLTPQERFAEFGIRSTTEITNSPKARIQCVTRMLNLYDGGLYISPACELVIRGFESDYKYRRVRAAGTMGAVFTAQPTKDDASHLADSVQYACLLIQQGTEKDDSEYREVMDAVRRHRQKLMRVV